MNPESIFCPNVDCLARGRRRAGNISVPSQVEECYCCDVCQETFSATKGTIYYRLKADPLLEAIFEEATTANNCPIDLDGNIF